LPHQRDEAKSAVDVEATIGFQGLADRLWRETRALHVQAERTGFINDVLRQRASRPRYVLFLRNLSPVYEALETHLERHAAGPLGVLALAEVFRGRAIRDDLAALHGPRWAQELPVLPEGADYVARIARAADADGVGLIGHAYTRYLGDLNGGQVLSRLLAQGLGLPASALSFYAFPGVEGPHKAAAAYRSAIDKLEEAFPDVTRAVEEAPASRARSPCRLRLRPTTAAHDPLRLSRAWPISRSSNSAERETDVRTLSSSSGICGMLALSVISMAASCAFSRMVENS
jgi:heme oxygenase